MKFNKGDKVRLRRKPAQTGTYIRDSMTEAYTGLVVWDKTHLTEFVSIGDIERVKDGCG